MIDVTFHVWCDGHDDDGEHCEAEFFHEQLNSLGRVMDLCRQAERRGWRVTRPASGKTRMLCPLHGQGDETP